MEVYTLDYTKNTQQLEQLAQDLLLYHCERF